MNKTKISIIAAVGKDREIGKNNQLLWHIPEDLKHFKEITKNHAVIMGQKTFESIGRPLPNRLNVVLSKDDIKIDGCEIAHSIDEAIEVGSKENNEIFIIGGGLVYAQAIGLADKLYLTLVDANFDADVFFPEYGDFTLVKDEPWQNCAEYKFKFTEWERIKK